MKINKPLLLITILFLFGVNTILAGDCRSRGTIIDEFKNSAAVFSGKVIAQEYKKVTDTIYTGAGLEVLHVKLKVDRWWKGSGDAEVIVRPGGARESGYTLRSSLDFSFTTNESYLVYATAFKSFLYTNDCSRTKTLDRADEDLKVLGEGFLPKPSEDNNLFE